MQKTRDLPLRERNLRIAYITNEDPKDLRSWSGLGYFIWQALVARGIEVELIGPLPMPLHRRKWNMAKWRFYHHLKGRFYWLDGDAANVRYRCREAARILKTIPPVDALFGLTTLASAFLPGDLPLLVYGDSTLGALYRTYPVHANMAALNYRHGEKIERAMQRRASALVYSSEWAAESARKDYGTAPAKIHVVPFGANLTTCPARADVEQAIEARDRQQIRLLFIGVDWLRKGGPTALAVTRQLNQMGIPATLGVMGCEPVLGAGDDKIVVRHGFVEKTAAGQAQMRQELSRSHFLIVPSIAEAFGIVYCEASAFSVPSIARNVGGVASAVRNGSNGQRFEPEDSPAKIAEWVAALFRDFESYRRLALSSRAEFEANLNWQVSGEKLENILRGIIVKK